MSFRKKALSTFLEEYKRNSTGAYPTPFCFVLGAGASVSSGIESGQALVRKWDKELEEDDPEGHEEWKKSLNITDENKPSHYSDYYVRKFNEEPNHGFNFLADMMEKAKPSIGYMVLGHILKDTTCKVVVTTNFDHLTEDAITDFCHVKSTVIGHEALAEFGSHDTARPLVVKLHRDFKYKPKSTLADTSTLDAKFKPLLDDIFSHCHPVFIGYAGNDNSLMDFLIAHKTDFKDGGKWKCPYWIAFDPEGRMKSKAEIRSKLEKKILDFIEDDTGHIIPSEHGFDDIMFLLAKKLNIGLPSEEDFLKDTKDLYATLKRKWAEKANKLDNKQVEKDPGKLNPASELIPTKPAYSVDTHSPLKKSAPLSSVQTKKDALQTNNDPPKPAPAKIVNILKRNFSGWKLQKQLDAKAVISSVSFTNDSRIVTGDWAKGIRIWDHDSSDFRQLPSEHSDWISSLVVTTDGRVVSGSGDSSIRIWDISSMKCLKKLEGHSGAVTSLSLTNNGNIVSGSRDRTIRIWSSNSGSCLHKLEGHSGSVRCVSLTPNGYIISGSADQSLRVWNAITGKEVRILADHVGFINCTVATNNRNVAIGSDTRFVLIYDLFSGECKNKLGGHTLGVNDLVSTTDGLIVSGSSDSTMRIWDAASGDCLQELKEHKGAINCLAINKGGRIVSGSSDGTFCIWDRQ